MACEVIGAGAGNHHARIDVIDAEPARIGGGEQAGGAGIGSGVILRLIVGAVGVPAHPVPGRGVALGKKNSDPILRLPGPTR